MEHWIKVQVACDFLESREGDRLVMMGLTTEMLRQACEIFLALAYPQGPVTMSVNKRCFAAMTADQPIEDFLQQGDICEKILTPQGKIRGYAFRLGSIRFPHIKLQVIDAGNGDAVVFAVDTHDTLRCSLSAPEAAVWEELQIANRQLKESIEREWEKLGLATFNSLLRQGLNRPIGS